MDGVGISNKIKKQITCQSWKLMTRDDENDDDDDDDDDDIWWLW